MPTITAQLFDLGKLIGEPITPEALEDALLLVKGEIKSCATNIHHLRVVKKREQLDKETG